VELLGLLASIRGRWRSAQDIIVVARGWAFRSPRDYRKIFVVDGGVETVTARRAKRVIFGECHDSHDWCDDTESRGTSLICLLVKGYSAEGTIVCGANSFGTKSQTNENICSLRDLEAVSCLPIARCVTCRTGILGTSFLSPDALDGKNLEKSCEQMTFAYHYQ